jgi:hypothetical protein
LNSFFEAGVKTWTKEWLKHGPKASGLLLVEFILRGWSEDTQLGQSKARGLLLVEFVLRGWSEDMQLDGVLTKWTESKRTTPR